MYDNVSLYSLENEFHHDLTKSFLLFEVPK